MSLTLHAITYHNIGPFLGTRTILLQHGIFLIKAPIGSGKSFLFFDGPIFALYKYASRNMLNVNQKTGDIKLLMSIDGDYYLITRMLKKGKKKDSTQSKFFKLQTHEQKISTILATIAQAGIVQNDIDIEELLKKEQVARDEIPHKNDTELQATLNDLLPPREVLTNTQFLLQDSDNIFAMQAADRITVFKNIFGLLSIDDAKDTVATRRRELQTKLKVAGDTTREDNKLQQQLTELQTNYQKLMAALPTAQVSLLASRQGLFADINSKIPQLAINNFALPNDALQALPTSHQIIKQQLQQAQAQQTVIAELTRQLATEQNSYKQLQQLGQAKQQEIDKLQKQAAVVDSKQADALKKQKHDHKKQLQAVEVQAPTQAFQELQNEYSDFWQRHEYDTILSPTLLNIRHTVQQLITLGKTTRQQQTLAQQQITQHQQRDDELAKQLQGLVLEPDTPTYQKRQKTIADKQAVYSEKHHNILKQRQLWSEKKQTHTTQLQALEKQREVLTQDQAKATTFYCQKIEADCPFVTQIATATLGKFEQQAQVLDEQHKQLLADFDEAAWQQQDQSLAEQLTTIEKQQQLLTTDPKQVLTDFLTELAQQQETVQEQQKKHRSDTHIQQLHRQIKHYEQDLATIKAIIQALERKNLQTLHERYQQLNQSYQKIDTQLHQYEQQLRDAEQQRKQITHLQGEIQATNKQLAQQQKKIDELQKDLTDKKASSDIQAVALRTNIEQTWNTFAQTATSIQQLIKDHKDKQIAIKQRQVQEKRLSNLYTIFSKELLYVVLEEALPALFDIINTYLAQVVDYTLQFELIKTASDKIELDVSIIDAKGTRPVKALSGGQRVILKLVWILAVASFLRINALFLDETINNLDQATVSRVADMLADFVRLHQCKLYVITHNQQIQSMELRDQVIEL